MTIKAEIRTIRKLLNLHFAGSGVSDVLRHHMVGLTGFEPATPWKDRADPVDVLTTRKTLDSLVLSRNRHACWSPVYPVVWNSCPSFLETKWRRIESLPSRRRGRGRLPWRDTLCSPTSTSDAASTRECIWIDWVSWRHQLVDQIPLEPVAEIRTRESGGSPGPAARASHCAGRRTAFCLS